LASAAAVALVVLIIELPETSRNAAGSCRTAAQRREKFFGSFFKKELLSSMFLG